MSPLPYLAGPIVYDPRLGIKPPQPTKPPVIGRERYPERYIFLLLAMLLFIRVVTILRRYRQAQDRESTAEYERLESRFGVLEEDETMDNSELPRVNTTRVLLPSEIARLSLRPMDDPYYVASLRQNTSNLNTASQLPEYDQLIQFGTNSAECDRGPPSHKSAATEQQATYFGDLPPTYVDATAQNSSGSPGNT